jgi:ankyrin repeat protein
MSAKRKIAKQLYESALGGDLKQCKKLLASGANPNYFFGKNRSNALSGAIFNGYSEIAVYLLEHGADPNIIDDDGQRPIHIVCDVKDLEVFEALVAKGAKLDVKDEASLNPLGYAIRSGSTHLCRRLIDLGVPIESCEDSDVVYGMLGNPELFDYFLEVVVVPLRIIILLHEKSVKFKYLDYVKKLKSRLAS